MVHGKEPPQLFTKRFGTNPETSRPPSATLHNHHHFTAGIDDRSADCPANERRIGRDKGRTSIPDSTICRLGIWAWTEEGAFQSERQTQYS